MTDQPNPEAVTAALDRLDALPGRINALNTLSETFLTAVTDRINKIRDKITVIRQAIGQLGALRTDLTALQRRIITTEGAVDQDLLERIQTRLTDQLGTLTAAVDALDTEVAELERATGGGGAAAGDAGGPAAGGYRYTTAASKRRAARLESRRSRRSKRSGRSRRGRRRKRSRRSRASKRRRTRKRSGGYYPKNLMPASIPSVRVSLPN